MEVTCNSLITNLDDLQLIKESNLKSICSNHRVSESLQKTILKSISPRNEEEYLTIADFCGQLGFPLLEEQVLVQMIIDNYYSTEGKSDQ